MRTASKVWHQRFCQSGSRLPLPVNRITVEQNVRRRGMFTHLTGFLAIKTLKIIDYEFAHGLKAAKSQTII